MDITVKELTRLDDFSACERLQLGIAGGVERLVIPTFALVTVRHSGGIMLGAYNSDIVLPPLHGALVDLVTQADGHAVGTTMFFGVEEEMRSHGIGQSLRRAERRHARRIGISLLRFSIDPLRGGDAHLAFNKLGAIGTGYIRNLYGPLPDPANSGLATDRITVEWWINSPRVNAINDDGRLPPHYRIGLDRIEVVTKTRVGSSGMRQLIEFNPAPTSGTILIEIPVDLDRLLSSFPKLARDWRVKTREVFEASFAKGYLLTGFLHAAGRSFHLLERRRKSAVLAG